MGQPTSTPPGGGTWRWDEAQDLWVSLTADEAAEHSARQNAADEAAAAAAEQSAAAPNAPRGKRQQQPLDPSAAPAPQE
jgi:hypothetical protein